jgi:nicotinate-nucleotide pyrophosphorylase (carboxylating)
MVLCRSINCRLKKIEPMTLDEIIDNALHEDIGDGDHTSLSIIPKHQRSRARLIIRQQGILAGIQVAEKVFGKVDSEIDFTPLISDGAPVKRGDVAFIVEGSAVSILSGERLALNFMQRMSGIATYTNQLVKLLNGLNTRLLDTRKTTPLLRDLEKYAVRMGGGMNHRMGLYDMVMIKDNHVDFAGGIENAIRSVYDYFVKTGRKLPVEIEVRNLEELQQVIETGGVDRIMLDNFSVTGLKKAVAIIDKRFETEASGGITEENIRAYAETGVDYISVGALTHQIKSLDMSLIAME